MNGVVALLRREERPGRHLAQTPAERVRGLEDDTNDLSETQGDNGEVITAQAQGRNADQQPRDRRRDTRDRRSEEC